MKCLSIIACVLCVVLRVGAQGYIVPNGVTYSGFMKMQTALLGIPMCPPISLFLAADALERFVGRGNHRSTNKVQIVK